MENRNEKDAGISEVTRLPFHPNSAERCFRQFVPNLRNHRGSHSAPFSFLVLALHNHINGRNGKCGFGQAVNGRIVFPLYHILIVLGAVVFI